MSMAGKQTKNSGDATSFGEALKEALGVVMEMQQITEVACPHPDCNGTAFVPVVNSDDALVMVRSEAPSADDHKGRCSEGHEVFVQYATDPSDR